MPVARLSAGFCPRIVSTLLGYVSMRGISQHGAAVDSMVCTLGC